MTDCTLRHTINTLLTNGMVITNGQEGGGGGKIEREGVQVRFDSYKRGGGGGGHVQGGGGEHNTI